MFKNIPQNRLLVYLLIVGFLPIFLALFLFYTKMQNLESYENEFQYTQQRALSRENKQSVNMAVREHFREIDHFYIDKNLENLTFLQPEVESLKQLINNPNFPEDENIRKRLEALLGKGNRLRFSEGTVQTSPYFQEVVETLAHPVEVNTSDLQQILCRIEGVSIGTCQPPPRRPQFVILDFRLDRKSISDKNDVFLLNLKLLKREFL